MVSLQFVLRLWNNSKSSVGKVCTCNAGDLGSIPGLGRSPGEGKVYPLLYSGLYSPWGCKELDTTEQLSLSLHSLTGQSVKNLPAVQETQVWFLVRKIAWRRKWQPTPVFLPGESHRQRSLAGYSPWGYKSIASLVAQLVKSPPAMQETWVQSLGWEDRLEKGKATHSSILA